MTSSVDPIFMCIPAVHGQNSKSFEEVRIDDYIRAYSTTGRPPLPCPPLPTDEHQRIALNLPPLFKPYTASSVSGEVPNPTPPQPPVQRIVNPSELPASQEFHATHAAGEIYQSISAQSGLTGFSHEELRYYAYLKGNKTSPTPILMEPFVMASTKLALPSPSGASATPEGHDTLENISAQPQYSSHSPEELRVAYMLTGRELTSAEIFQRQGVQPPAPPATPAAPARPAIFGSGTLGNSLGVQPALRPFFNL